MLDEKMHNIRQELIVKTATYFIESIIHYETTDPIFKEAIQGNTDAFMHYVLPHMVAHMYTAIIDAESGANAKAALQTALTYFKKELDRIITENGSVH